jgi:16S rRNA processing protein RimM
MEKENYYKVGTIVNTHGIRGEVKIAATTDFGQIRFAKKATLLIATQTGYDTVQIATSRVHKGMYLVLFDGVNNINDIEHYKGHDVYAVEDLRDALAEDEYHYADIIGSKVQTQAGESIGTVTSVLELPANDVWTVQRPDGTEVLLPVINDVILSVDTQAGVIVIDVLEGLLD